MLWASNGLKIDDSFCFKFIKILISSIEWAFDPKILFSNKEL